MPMLSVPVAAAGSAGSAVGSGNSEPFEGFITGYIVTYANAPATTDVTLTETATGEVLLTLTNRNTNGAFPVKEEQVDEAGAAFATPLYDYHHNPGSPISVAVAQANDDTEVTVKIKYVKGKP